MKKNTAPTIDLSDKGELERVMENAKREETLVERAASRMREENKITLGYRALFRTTPN